MRFNGLTWWCAAALLVPPVVGCTRTASVTGHAEPVDTRSPQTTTPQGASPLPTVERNTARLRGVVLHDGAPVADGLVIISSVRTGLVPEVDPVGLITDRSGTFDVVLPSREEFKLVVLGGALGLSWQGTVLLEPGTEQRLDVILEESPNAIGEFALGGQR